MGVGSAGFVLVSSADAGGVDGVVSTAEPLGRESAVARHTMTQSSLLGPMLKRDQNSSGFIFPVGDRSMGVARQQLTGSSSTAWKRKSWSSGRSPR